MFLRIWQYEYRFDKLSVKIRKKIWQSLIIVADLVLNNFINERVTVNFNDLLSRITSGQDSTPYMSIDRHLVRIKFKTTASDANRPTSLKIALSALKN